MSLRVSEVLNNETLEPIHRPGSRLDESAVTLSRDLKACLGIHTPQAARAECDRCGIAWYAWLNQDGSLELDKTQYPESTLQRGVVTVPPETLASILSRHIRYCMKSAPVWSGALWISISPAMCPGNTNDTCLNLAPASYWGVTILNTPTGHVTWDLAAWRARSSPPLRILRQEVQWHKMGQHTPISDSWKRYLMWRYLWIRYWFKKEPREPIIRLHRMWGHVTADFYLQKLDLLSAGDIEEVYGFDMECLQFLKDSNLSAEIEVLERFAGIRRDLLRASFNKLKAVTQKAHTAVHYCAHNQQGPRYQTKKRAIKIRFNELVQLMNTLGLPSSPSTWGRLGSQTERRGEMLDSSDSSRAEGQRSQSYTSPEIEDDKQSDTPGIGGEHSNVAASSEAEIELLLSSSTVLDLTTRKQNPFGAIGCEVKEWMKRINDSGQLSGEQDKIDLMRTVISERQSRAAIGSRHSIICSQGDRGM